LALRWKNFSIKPKEIWQVDLTVTDLQGHEQRGDRPCLIVKVFPTGDMILLIPITGELESERFPYTTKIERTKDNGLDSDSIALVFQMKSISKSRFKYKRGRLSNSKFNEIRIHFKNIFEF
jgi:mRNA-degrading endonuclease toxin of MazEF toxin-antitoxin module